MWYKVLILRFILIILDFKKLKENKKCEGPIKIQSPKISNLEPLDLAVRYPNESIGMKWKHIKFCNIVGTIKL